MRIYNLLSGGLKPVDYALIAVMVGITLALITIVVIMKIKGKSGCGNCANCRSSSTCKGSCEGCNACSSKKEEDMLEDNQNK